MFDYRFIVADGETLYQIIFLIFFTQNHLLAPGCATIVYYIELH